MSEFRHFKLRELSLSSDGSVQVQTVLFKQFIAHRFSLSLLEA